MMARRRAGNNDQPSLPAIHANHISAATWAISGHLDIVSIVAAAWERRDLGFAAWSMV